MTSIQSSLIRFLLKRTNLWNKPLGEIRETLKNTKAQGMPLSIKEELTTINGVNCHIFVPYESLEKKAILYFHGGGFCLGVYNSNREFAARIAQECRIKVFLPDYRLAPENPYPAALEDSVAFFKGMLTEGYLSSDIGVVGDSSGCGLLLSALLLLKESSTNMPAAISMITPVLDFAGKGDSFVTNAKKDPFRLKDPLGIAKLYLASNNPLDPDISPLYGNLFGLPPILIHGAEYDVFLSDAIRFNELAINSGIDVDFKIWQKMWHIFHMQDTMVPEAKMAIHDICVYMKNMLN